VALVTERLGLCNVASLPKICCSADIRCVPASATCPNIERTATEERSALGFASQETVTAGGEWQVTQSARDREG
jgi:hypothetical protein